MKRTEKSTSGFDLGFSSPLYEIQYHTVKSVYPIWSRWG